ncbi:hypothetical protein MHU86_10367 [Fragilaria crotonensis]|nr:hypothetical protein MHU86_10367 [Fragilaria crotonensis]
MNVTSSLVTKADHDNAANLGRAHRRGVRKKAVDLAERHQHRQPAKQVKCLFRHNQADQPQFKSPWQLVQQVSQVADCAQLEGLASPTEGAERRIMSDSNDCWMWS